jgi:hypothetical protein
MIDNFGRLAETVADRASRREFLWTIGKYALGFAGMVAGLLGARALSRAGGGDCCGLYLCDSRRPGEKFKRGFHECFTGTPDTCPTSSSSICCPNGGGATLHSKQFLPSCSQCPASGCAPFRGGHGEESDSDEGPPPMSEFDD